MTFKPMESHLMPAPHSKKAFPQVHVLLVLKARGLPVPEPALIDSLYHITRIAPNLNPGMSPLYRFQAHDNPQEFHSVIGRFDETSAHLFTKLATNQNRGPASRARVPARRSVCKKINRALALPLGRQPGTHHIILVSRIHSCLSSNFPLG